MLKGAFNLGYFDVHMFQKIQMYTVIFLNCVGKISHGSGSTFTNTFVLLGLKCCYIITS